MDKSLLKIFNTSAYNHGLHDLSGDWVEFTNSDKLECSKYGFFGIVFKNNATNEYAISFSDMSVDNPYQGSLHYDLKTAYDIRGKQDYITPQYAMGTVPFVKKVMEQIKKVDGSFKEAKITLTGDGLGAVLSDLSFYQLKFLGVKDVKVENFENPGSKGIVEKLLIDMNEKFHNNIKIDDFKSDIHHYNDSINSPSSSSFFSNYPLYNVLTERPLQTKESILQVLSSSRSFNALDKLSSIYTAAKQIGNFFQDKIGYSYNFSDTVVEQITGYLGITDMIVKDDLRGIKYVKPISDMKAEIEIKMDNVEKHYDFSSLYILNPGVIYKSGFVLNAGDNRFGEWSGMDFKKDANGNVFLEAVSDRGNFLEAKMKFDDNGKLQKLNDAVIGKIAGLSENEDDIEDLAIYKEDDGNINYIITHEKVSDKKTKKVLSDNNISVYKGGDFENAASRSVFSPESISKLEHNKGLEALGVSPKKHILSINEYAEKKSADLHHVHIWKDLTFNEEVADNLFYQSAKGYQVSGLTFLSNGGLLVLERNFTPKIGGLAEDYFIKVKFVSPSALENSRDGIIEGKEILEINNNTQMSNKYSLADNFESIAVTEFDDGHISFFMLTDDNRAPTQRTLLLQFDIDKELINEDFSPLIEAPLPTSADFVE